MSDSLTVLSRHVVNTLPDALSERKILLTALKHVMGPDHPARKTVLAYLAAIAAIEDNLQPALASEFQKQRPLNFGGDGQ